MFGRPNMVMTLLASSLAILLVSCNRETATSNSEAEETTSPVRPENLRRISYDPNHTRSKVRGYPRKDFDVDSSNSYAIDLKSRELRFFATTAAVTWAMSLKVSK